MADPNVLVSDEVARATLAEELLIAVDWQARYHSSTENLRSIKRVLDDATDAKEIITLTELQSTLVIHCYGTLALWHNKETTLQERQSFEVEFST